jgi:PKD repeat protein
MRRRLLATSSLACVMLCIMASSAFAQNLRPLRTFYFYPKVGITNYTGDRDLDFTSHWDSGDEDDHLPIGFGLEIGYQITNRFSLGGEGHFGWYPNADDPLAEPADDDDVGAFLGKLIGRWTIGASNLSLAPFVEAGLFGATAVEDNDNGEHTAAFGPLLGIGLDWSLAPQLSLMLELQGMMAVPDDAFDGIDGNATGGEDVLEPEDEGALQEFDYLGNYTLGLKYSLRGPITPVLLSSLNCPSTLQVGQSGNFSATINDDATEPVELRWDFGDNGTGTGTTTTHSFNAPGNYAVTFSAMNRGGEAVRTCVVNVVPVPVAASITSLTASPQQFQACAPTVVTFNAAAAGDQPVTYSWNFGDGTTGSGQSLTHTYTQPGNYTVTLTVTNAAGTANRTINVTAAECESVCDDVTELNSVYFDLNSSVLTAEARAALQENLEILEECPEICVRIEGWASPTERNPQQLSTDRARAVAQFYQDNGIPASRLPVTGMGVCPGGTKEGAAQCQRVDSIPTNC